MIETYLSSMAFSGGHESHLDDTTDSSLTSHRDLLIDEGASKFLVHEGSIAELAADASSASLRRWGGSVDAVIYASDPASTDDLMTFLSAMNLGTKNAAAVGGLGCGNLAVALQVARGQIAMGASSVLVATADQADGPRLRANGMTVLSDAAASMVVSSSPRADAFRICGIATEIDPSVPYISSAMARARATMRTVKDASSRMPLLPPGARFMTGNYGRSSLEFLTMAAGFDLDDLVGNATATIGHAFAADIIYALMSSNDTSAENSDYYRVLVTSSQSWSLIDLEACVNLSDNEADISRIE